MIIVELLFKVDSLGMKEILSALLIKGTIPGGTHLWFISNILICYIIIPVLKDMHAMFHQNTFKACLLSVVLANYFIIVHTRSYHPDAITCFIIAYFIGLYELHNRNIPFKITIIFGLLAIILNLGQVYIQYFSGIVTHYSHDNNIIEIIIGYNHTLLAVFVLLLFINYREFFQCKNAIIQSMCRISDKYSYYGYLVHHFIILGPLSMTYFSSYITFNILLIIVTIFVMGKILYVISSEFDKVLLKGIGN